MIHLIENGYSSLIRMMLDKGFDINEEFDIHDNYRTPLINACRIGNFGLVKKLIEEGADINYKTKKGWTS